MPPSHHLAPSPPLPCTVDRYRNLRRPPPTPRTSRPPPPASLPHPTPPPPPPCSLSHASGPQSQSTNPTPLADPARAPNPLLGLMWPSRACLLDLMRPNRQNLFGPTILNRSVRSERSDIGDPSNRTREICPAERGWTRIGPFSLARPNRPSYHGRKRVREDGRERREEKVGEERREGEGGNVDRIYGPLWSERGAEGAG